MGAGLIGMGLLHFAAPKGFDAIIPPELPFAPRTLTYASGVAELVIGAACCTRGPGDCPPWPRPACSWPCSRRICTRRAWSPASRCPSA